jgi:hypothetical protein
MCLDYALLSLENKKDRKNTVKEALLLANEVVPKMPAWRQLPSGKLQILRTEFAKTYVFPTNKAKSSLLDQARQLAKRKKERFRQKQLGVKEKNKHASNASPMHGSSSTGDPGVVPVPVEANPTGGLLGSSSAATGVATVPAEASQQEARVGPESWRTALRPLRLSRSALP